MKYAREEHASNIRKREYPPGTVNILKEYVHVATVENTDTYQKITIKVKGNFAAFCYFLEALMLLDDHISWDVKKTVADFNDDVYTLSLPRDQLLLADRVKLIALAMGNDRKHSVSLKDGMVDVWFTLNNEEFEDYIIVPEAITRAGSGTLTDYIDNIVGCLDNKGFQSIGFTQTW